MKGVSCRAGDGLGGGEQPRGTRAPAPSPSRSDLGAAPQPPHGEQVCVSGAEPLPWGQPGRDSGSEPHASSTQGEQRAAWTDLCVRALLPASTSRTLFSGPRAARASGVRTGYVDPRGRASAGRLPGCRGQGQGRFTGAPQPTPRGGASALPRGRDAAAGVSRESPRLPFAGAGPGWDQGQALPPHAPPASGDSSPPCPAPLPSVVDVAVPGTREQVALCGPGPFSHTGAARDSWGRPGEACPGELPS